MNVYSSTKMGDKITIFQYTLNNNGKYQDVSNFIESPVEKDSNVKFISKIENNLISLNIVSLDGEQVFEIPIMTIKNTIPENKLSNEKIVF